MGTKYEQNRLKNIQPLWFQHVYIDTALKKNPKTCPQGQDRCLFKFNTPGPGISELSSYNIADNFVLRKLAKDVLLPFLVQIYQRNNNNKLKYMYIMHMRSETRRCTIT